MPLQALGRCSLGGDSPLEGTVQVSEDGLMATVTDRVTTVPQTFCSHPLTGACGNFPATSLPLHIVRENHSMAQCGHQFYGEGQIHTPAKEVAKSRVRSARTKRSRLHPRLPEPHTRTGMFTGRNQVLPSLQPQLWGWGRKRLSCVTFLSSLQYSTKVVYTLSSQ